MSEIRAVGARVVQDFVPEELACGGAIPFVVSLRERL